MKAQLVPLFFPNRDEDFDNQTRSLKALLSDHADILDPVALGDPLPGKRESW